MTPVEVALWNLAMVRAAAGVGSPVFDPSYWYRNDNRRTRDPARADEERLRWRGYAAEIEAAVRRSGSAPIERLTVVESDDNIEAWVRVRVELLERPGELEAILTWQNCD